MTPENIRSSMASYLSASWATCTDISWPNIVFTPEEGSSWIRPIIKMGNTYEGELGETGVGVRNGVLMISVFTPLDSGTKTGYDLAGRLETAFRRRITSEGIMFGEPNTTEVGKDPNGFYHHLMSVGFQTFVGE